MCRSLFWTQKKLKLSFIVLHKCGHTNVWCNKNQTKGSSKTLLCLVWFSMHQTLLGLLFKRDYIHTLCLCAPIFLTYFWQSRWSGRGCWNPIYYSPDFWHPSPMLARFNSNMLRYQKKKKSKSSVLVRLKNHNADLFNSLNHSWWKFTIILQTRKGIKIPYV